ncbi:hypothetical protein [Angustibacter sp. Root456]|uniref:hypothetical protein n=1 Tax=Angustibacter sp. Root456 TaxID=1736539 RepID=UPI0006F685A4|nr:hypothetical protein [Angustibacter sp. Root456]KQX65788.1 hypothetical protein ASD06_09285 [Angustibacter sp. Root456]
MSERQRKAAAEFCRAHFGGRYPRWVDHTGISRPLNEHPCYEKCRGAVRAGRVCRRWTRDVARFVYEVTDLVGFPPTGWEELAPVRSGQPIHASNVRWVMPTARRKLLAMQHRLGERYEEVERQAEREGLPLLPEGRPLPSHRQVVFGPCVCDWSMRDGCPCAQGASLLDYWSDPVDEE